MGLGGVLVRALEPAFRRKEEELERDGEWQAAQRLRKKQFKWQGVSEKEWVFIRDFVRVEFIGLLLVQRETFLKDKLEVMYKCIAAEPAESEMQELQEQVHIIDERLEVVNDKYRHYCWAMHRFNCELKDGPLQRGLCSHRRHVQWHLSDFLRWHCAGRGGCCARNCGCCEKPRSATRRMGATGHCTPACGCCREHSGITRLDHGIRIDFPGRIDSLSSLDPAHVKFRVSDLDDRTFSGRMMNAYIWGL